MHFSQNSNKKVFPFKDNPGTYCILKVEINNYYKRLYTLSNIDFKLIKNCFYNTFISKSISTCVQIT